MTGQQAGKEKTMLPYEINDLVKKVRRYGTIAYDKETEENGSHYRTTHYLLDDGFYDICMKDGEIISFGFISFP